MQGIQLASGRENPETLTRIDGGNSTSGRERGEIMNLLKVCKDF